ncbi:uncharacterized protein SETTUDRAFT_174792 [Exserohilum turcica Et28A]|uniref:TauD/TfdA-like domain-containing protein n=1 Tax=Exserohilum turcicum (strain 28A) TaxID=671987 RepID=R0J0W6_EXST2|nr:uncharacterized protein SETTUDRAFT_174792 [Exserohilum turcica Et28A]EOA90590.1 hypothetical protein SETTUDRAFT_174792 [Exserohilum turcica Et28A]
MVPPALSTRSSSESLYSNSSSVCSAPDRLPPAITGPMVWQGNELDPAEYVVQLSDGEIRDIRAAIIKFKLTGLARSEISAKTFDLGNPELANKLSSLSKDIHLGRGVVVLRGLDTAYLNDEEAVIAFVGVCSHICPERATDSYANQTLSHVLDATKKPVPAECRGIGLAGSKVTAAMDFHSDRFSGDVLALYVRNDGGPGAGGKQSVVSFARIYNELLQSDPEVLETLAEPDWPFELKKKDGAPYLEPGPILFFSQGKPICQLVKAPLLGTPNLPRDAQLPPLSARQHRALAAVERLAKQFSTQLDRQPGDIQLVHNLSVMHARSEYRGARRSKNSHSSSSSSSSSMRRMRSSSNKHIKETHDDDDEDAPSTRHLLRMFLRDPTHAWAKPHTTSTTADLRAPDTTASTTKNSFDDPFEPGRPQNLPVFDTDPWRIISGRESHG